MIPMMIPSTTNGALTKKSVAPMYFMILISSFLTAIPMVTVLLIRNIDTKSRMMIIPAEIYAISTFKPLKVLAVTSERLTSLTTSIDSI